MLHICAECLQSESSSALKYPILALLEHGPNHGLGLKRAFEDQFGSVWPALNVGQVYATPQRRIPSDAARRRARRFSHHERRLEDRDQLVRAPGALSRLRPRASRPVARASGSPDGTRRPVRLKDEHERTFIP